MCKIRSEEKCLIPPLWKSIAKIYCRQSKPGRDVRDSLRRWKFNGLGLVFGPVLGWANFRFDLRTFFPFKWHLGPVFGLKFGRILWSTRFGPFRYLGLDLRHIFREIKKSIYDPFEDVLEKC